MKKIIELPNKVVGSFSNDYLIVKGPKGEVKRAINQKNVSVNVDANKIIIESIKETKREKKNMGSLLAHIKNMITGVSVDNYVYTSRICSGHFPMNVSLSGNKFIVKNYLGEKSPRILKIKDGVNVKIDGSLIHVTSPDKDIAGQVSADIEQLMRRTKYDNRVFQDGIWIISKAGKELK